MRFLLLSAAFFLLLSCSKTGDKLPNFSATTLEGKLISTENLKGKIVVIKVWATWCGPCIREIPELNEVVQENQTDTNVVFLAVTDDSSDKIQSFLKSTPFNYQLITDANHIKDQLQTGPVQYIPEHIVVNQQGEIVFDEWDQVTDIGKKLRQKIAELKEVGKI